MEARSGQHNRVAAARQTGDVWIDLYAATVRQAIADANERHDRSAAAWLWTVEPGIAERALRFDE